MKEQRLAKGLLALTLGLSAVLVVVNYCTQPRTIHAMSYRLYAASLEAPGEAKGQDDLAAAYQEELSAALRSLYVDVNTATREELMALPGIGEVLAGRILEERAAAPFESLDDLQRVRGIGPKTVEKLAPYALVSQ